jgi:hypothetical protein
MLEKTTFQIPNFKRPTGQDSDAAAIYTELTQISEEIIKCRVAKLLA